ncbi:MAG: hypothetical protein RI953_1923 [Pseudomonadota bacterium]|jgi:hypothetical protein
MNDIKVFSKLSHKNNILSHLERFAHSAAGRSVVRFVAFFLFIYVFVQARIHFAYIKLDLALAYRCAFWGGVASFGLFLSSFSIVRKNWLIGLPIYLPTMPSVLFFASSLIEISLLLILLTAYPFLIFFRKTESK